jgi:membrane protein
MLKKLLTTPTAQLGRVSRFVIFQIKMWTHCARLLRKNRAGQQAAALAYHTIFGLVPLAVVILLIFQSLPAYSGVGEKVKTVIYKQLHLSTLQFPDPANPQQHIMFTEHLDRIVSRVFEGLNQGTIALFSAVIIIWVALALLLTIEKAFNNIWHISRGRSFLNRIINYWALLTLGPLLLGLGIYITTRSAALGQLQRTLFSYIGPAVLSYIVATVAFFLLYFVLPNTKVKTTAALWGAAVAAFVWTLAKWGFGLYVVKFVPYSAIYGVLGLIPLGVLWIFVTWLIVLFGLQLTFTTQYLEKLDAAEIAAAERPENYFIANDFTIINIVREIASAFESDKAPVQAEVICSRLSIPAGFGEKIFNHLIAGGIIVRSSEPRVGFLPARDPANIRLSEIAALVASAGFAQPTAGQSRNLEQITQSQRQNLAGYTLKHLLDDNERRI